MTQSQHRQTMLACLLAFFSVFLVAANDCSGQRVQAGPFYGVRPNPTPVVPDQQPVDLLTKQWDSKSQIDWGVAATLALLSKTAYEKDDELMGFVATGMGFKSCQSFNKANSAAHVLISDEVVVIAFRGTEFSSIADWKTDAYIRFFEDPNLGNLHTGFNKAYENVRKDIENILQQSAGKTIWVTGHSLGGAMAVICAASIKEKRLGNPKIVTFGQPRVGDKAVAKWIDRAFPNSYQRFVNDNDIVARLPYSNRWFPYSDAGRFIHLDRGRLQLLTGGRTEMLAQSMAPQENKLLTYTPQPTTVGTYGTLTQSTVSGGVFSREIYQSPDALMPLEENELDQLIVEEQNAAQQRPNQLYFPNGNAATSQTLPLYGNSPTVGAVRASWWSFDKISDHYMEGYLKLIRGLRR